MEKPPEKKRGPVERVINVEEEVERRILKTLDDRFEEPGSVDNEKDFKTKEHSPEVLEVIQDVNQGLKGFLAQYGVEAIEFPPHKIFIPEPKPEEKDQFRAFYRADANAIVISIGYKPTRAHFATILAHELLHANSFASYQATHEKDPRASSTYASPKGKEIPLLVRRVGFSIVTDGTREKAKSFFDLNEAITSELQIRFTRDYLLESKALTPQERARARKAWEHDGMDIVTEEINRDGINTVEITRLFPYPNYRKKFNELLDDLYAKNQAAFQSREEVFTLFAKATLTGRLLELARLVRSTYGKGSFRTLGDRVSEPENG